MTHTKLTVGTNMICLIVDMKGDTMNTNRLSLTPWTGNSEDRKTETSKQACPKQKVNIFILFSQRTTFPENFKYRSAKNILIIYLKMANKQVCYASKAYQ